MQRRGRRTRGGPVSWFVARGASCLTLACAAVWLPLAPAVAAGQQMADTAFHPVIAHPAYAVGNPTALRFARVIGRPDAPVGRMGMNVPGSDDVQVALNVLHWLSREID